MKILLEAPEVYILTSTIEDAFAQYVWELHRDGKLTLPKLVSIFEARAEFYVDSQPELAEYAGFTWHHADITITVSP